MFGIIKKNVYYVVFEKKACLLALCSDELHAPCYPAPVVMLLSSVILLKLSVSG